MPVEPLHAAPEGGKLRDVFGIECLHGEKWNQSDHRANVHGYVLVASSAVQDVVVEAILLVPQADSLTAHVVHGLRYVNEMLEELAGHIFVCGIIVSELHGHGEHVQAEHGHPAGAIGLLDEAPGTQGL